MTATSFCRVQTWPKAADCGVATWAVARAHSGRLLVTNIRQVEAGEGGEAGNRARQSLQVIERQIELL